MSTSYRMDHGRLRDLGAFALGAVEHAALTHPSAEVREFAQQQLDLWVQYGYIMEEPLSTSGEVRP